MCLLPRRVALHHCSEHGKSPVATQQRILCCSGTRCLNSFKFGICVSNDTHGDGTSTTSDFYPAPLMLRTCIGLLACSLSLTAQATQPESPQLDLFSIQLNHTATGLQSSYRFDATVASTASNNLVFSKTSLPTISELKKGQFWITSIRWHLTADDNRASLSPLLRFESKKSLIEFRPLQRSLWMTWHFG